jgi:hypothetical protein
MAARMPGVGLVTVSLRKSMNGSGMKYLTGAEHGFTFRALLLVYGSRPLVASGREP